MTTTFAVRVDAQLKKDAERVAKGLGMDLATCVRMLFTQMVQRGTLPLLPLTINGLTEEEERTMLEKNVNTNDEHDIHCTSILL